MARVADDVFHLLLCGIRPDTDSSDVSPGEVSLDEEFSLTTPLAVRITVCIKPVPAGHNAEVNFTEIAKLVKKGFGLAQRVTIREDECEAPPCDVLCISNKIDDVILIFGLPCYVPVFISKQHRRAGRKVEWYIIAKRPAG